MVEGSGDNEKESDPKVVEVWVGGGCTFAPWSPITGSQDKDDEPDEDKEKGDEKHYLRLLDLRTPERRPDLPPGVMSPTLPFPYPAISSTLHLPAFRRNGRRCRYECA